MPRPAFAAALLLSALPAADPVPGCDPKPALDLVAPLERATRACRKEPACLAKADKDWQALLADHPGDVRAHRAHIRLWRELDAPKVEQFYKARLDASPQDALAVLLYGLSLAAERVPEKVEHWQKALALHASFPWAHWLLARHYVWDPDHRDFEKAKGHVRAWLAACPADAEGLSMAAAVNDKAFTREIVEAARPLIEKGGGEWALARYDELWPAEFKIATTAEHASARERIRADLEHIHGMKLESSKTYWKTVALAHEMLGDNAARDTAREKMIERFPCDADSLYLARQLWDKRNPMPDLKVGSKDETGWTDARYAFAKGLTERCPESSVAWSQRFAAGAGLGYLPDKELVGVVDAFLEAVARPSSTGAAASVPYTRIAELYLSRDMRVDQIPGLLDRAKKEAPPITVRRRASEKDLLQHEAYRRRTEWHDLWLRARAKSRLGPKAERDASLAELKKRMEAETDKDNRRLMASQHAQVLAEIAEREKRWADAFAYYQSAIAGSRDGLVEVRAREVWKKLGGSPEARRQLAQPAGATTEVTAATRWTDVERTLPATTLERLGGGQWTPAAFQGRRTLVNFWATWCGPCKQELPHLQTLHEKVKDRADVAVVTLNVDDNVGLVEPFMRDNKYTFPVILASELWDSLDVTKGIPQNWIVDEKGTVRLESLGFGHSEGDRWVQDMIARLDGGAGGRAAAP